jgi:hypothetical protein
MATRVLPFTVTIPPGTTPTAPATIPIALDTWIVERFDLEVPPGPSGLMGFQLYNNGVAWIPYGAKNWIVWDDNTESYYLNDQPVAGGWSVVGYNEGFYPHSVTIRAHVTSAVTAPTPAAAPASQLTFVSDVPDTMVEL